MATGRQFFGGRARWRVRAWSNLPLLPLLFIGLIALAAVSIRETDLATFLLEPPSPIVGTIAPRSFGLCGRGVRKTCVVDGDTFWLDGTKIRIADINTPEIGEPQCAEEAALGRSASLRLAELLSGATLNLRAADRDEDRYGRKLRLVERDGRSVGQVLVSEGLAHEWRGHRESWC